MTKDSLKNVLETITTKVSNQDDDSLEIIGKDFPLRTLVTVTDYYIQLAQWFKLLVKGSGLVLCLDFTHYTECEVMQGFILVTRWFEHPNHSDSALGTENSTMVRVRSWCATPPLARLWESKVGGDSRRDLFYYRPRRRGEGVGWSLPRREFESL